MKYAELDGVVLTPNAIAQLKELHLDNSEAIFGYIEELDLLINKILDCSISKTFDLSDREILENLILLRNIKSVYVNLKSPNRI